MTYMFVMVRSIQMIVHLPMMQPLFPANVVMIIKILIPTIGFDILDNYFDWETQNLWTLDFETHEDIKSNI